MQQFMYSHVRAAVQNYPKRVFFRKGKLGEYRQVDKIEKDLQ